MLSFKEDKVIGGAEGKDWEVKSLVLWILVSLRRKLEVVGGRSL